MIDVGRHVASEAARSIVALTAPRCTLPRCASHRNPGIQMYKRRASCQIATLLERAAWFAHSSGKAGS